MRSYGIPAYVSRKSHCYALCVLATLTCTTPVSGSGESPSQQQLPTTVEDFFEPGTQENTLTDQLQSAQSCRVCHSYQEDGNPDELVAPYDNWITSMMAQAARDPIWHAALAIANQDVGAGGDSCIRCHSPNGWLGGRSVPTDGSALTNADLEGVSCNFCHRVVDPQPSKQNPKTDDKILKALAREGLLPTASGNAQYVVDPRDTRRGPLDDVPANYHGVPILVSPFHRDSQFCGTCHDVSNPLFRKNKKGKNRLTNHDAAHPTLDPHDMMPEQRTYSEWLHSDFAKGGVFFSDGRFGGNHPTGVMQSCQDCHMPKQFGGLCVFWQDDPFFPREDIGQHSFTGANTWVLGAVFDAYGSSETDLTPELVELARQRTETMLRNASDTQVMQIADMLKVRVINFSGHKLPTGYPEGRRLWINVKFLDSNSNLIQEYGAYDFDNAVLSSSDTKVYESVYGIDKYMSKETGLNAGPTFHLTLNNTVLKDNRIPPMGFTNEAFEEIQAAPVGQSYADGQYWDDTTFDIPGGATAAVVTFYYQTTSREYIEFLRDANKTNTAGQDAYNLWVSHGKSAPVDMDTVAIQLGPPRVGDVNFDGVVNVNDLRMVISKWGTCTPPDLCDSNTNDDNEVDVNDLRNVIFNWD